MYQIEYKNIIAEINIHWMELAQSHAPRHPSPEVGGFSSKADDKMGSREVVSPAPD